MLRADLDDIPEPVLSAGLQVRPIAPEQYRAIWEADVEGSQNHGCPEVAARPARRIERCPSGNVKQGAVRFA